MKASTKSLIIKLSEQAKIKNLSLVIAESCTGGGIAYLISQIPSASPILERAFVTYSDQSKQELLGIKAVDLKKHGAVSQEIAKKMAEGALKNSHADIGIAITGLAGPGSDDTSNEDIGTVYIACTKGKDKTKVRKKKFQGTRHRICEQTIIEALKQLIQFIKSSAPAK